MATKIKDMNCIILVGRFAGDPAKSVTSAGVEIANFGIITNDAWVDSAGEQRERSDYHQCVAWAGLGSVVNQWGRKGRLVCIRGRQRHDVVENNGEKKYYSKIDVDFFQLLDPKGSHPTGGADRPSDEELLGL